MSKYTISNNDLWKWRNAIHTDVEAIMDLMQNQYKTEIDGVFSINRTRMAYHLHDVILKQSFYLNKDLLQVAMIGDKLVAWSWITRGKYQPYSDDEMACAEFVHVDLTLPVRQRITLVAQVLESWIDWCVRSKIPVLTSSSIREEQTSFMKLHDQYGFKRNGSYAYKRIL